jgi:hypothetical protein
MAVLRILNIRGDDSIEYDPALEDERLLRARETFEAKVGKGYLAFVPGDGVGDGTQIRRFDRKAQEIILQPAISGG